MSQPNPTEDHRGGRRPARRRQTPGGRGAGLVSGLLHHQPGHDPRSLAWDLGWIAVIGLPPLLAALLLLRGRDNDAGPPRPGRGGVATAAMLALAVLAAAPVAALPPAKVTTALVLFRPGLGFDGAFAAVAAAEGRVVWAAASGEILAVDLGSEGSAWSLYRHGALLVGTSLPVANCLSWSQIRGERAL